MKTLLIISLLTSLTFADDKKSEDLFWANMRILDFATTKVFSELDSLNNTLLKKVKLSKQFKINLIESNVSALITTYKLGKK
tara:strand:+ start:1045 stop:1290 length:246 start_codon:yes stop_codon:yes gene_type:complete